MTTRKGWRRETLAARHVELDADGRYVFRHVRGDVRYADDGREPKMLANGPRNLWPAPEDVTHDVVAVTEGEPDALTLWELDVPAIGVPGGSWDDEWAERIAFGRLAVYVLTDCDEKPNAGRTKARKIADAIAATGVDTFLVDPDPSRHDGYDVGDLLMDAIAANPEHGRESARTVVDALMAEAVAIVPASAAPASPAPAPSWPTRWTRPRSTASRGGSCGRWNRIRRPTPPPYSSNYSSPSGT